MKDYSDFSFFDFLDSKKQKPDFSFLEKFEKENLVIYKIAFQLEI
jgi:hypothetical protein